MTNLQFYNGNHIADFRCWCLAQRPSFSSVFAFLSFPGCFARTSPEPLERFIPALTKEDEGVGDIPSDAPPRSPACCDRGLGLPRLPMLPRLPGMPLVRLIPILIPRPSTVMVDGVGRVAPRLSVDLAKIRPLRGGPPPLQPDRDDPPESAEPSEVTDCLL